jgi:hypothetical protein
MASKDAELKTVMAGLVPAIHVFLLGNPKDVDARQRRQVYVVCASTDYYGRA